MGKVIAFFSGEKGGTGKTTLSVLSLIFLAEEQRRVVLLDMSIDMNYMGTLLKSLPKDSVICQAGCGRFGIFDYLLGNCRFVDTLHQIKGADAIIIPAGDVAIDRMQDVDYRKLGEILNAFRKKDITVIVDLPALRLYEPIAQVLQYCDDVVFVIEPVQEHVRYFERLALAIKKLFDIDRDRVKVVFNKVLSEPGAMLTQETIDKVKHYARDWYKITYVHVKYKTPASLPEILLKRYVLYLRDRRSNEHLIRQVEEAMLRDGRSNFTKFLLG